MSIAKSWSKSGDMRDRQRTRGLGQKMNSENLNGWKCLDEKRMRMKKICLGWVQEVPYESIEGINFC
jgi:hypothetical protein